MADYDVEKIKKIIRMLESEHDGEAAAAARMLALHAKKQGHNVTEMLGSIYGGGGGGMLQYRLDAALHMVEVAKEAVAVAMARAEEEKAKRIALERHRDAGFTATSAPRPQQDDRNAFWNAAANAQAQPPPWGADPFKPGSGGWNPPPPPPPGPPWMEILREMFDRHGVSMLTQWEQNFVVDLVDRGTRYLSEKQEAVVVRIVAKYRQWEDTGNCGFYNVGR
jgi:hypothetical protein